MANEYDVMPAKQSADWDRFFRIVQTGDPYQHLRSVHNCRGFYDHAKPWVTHCSVQSGEIERVPEWLKQYRKPVVLATEQIFATAAQEADIRHELGRHRLACYHMPHQAAVVLRALTDYGLYRRRLGSSE